MRHFLPGLIFALAIGFTVSPGIAQDSYQIPKEPAPEYLASFELKKQSTTAAHLMTSRELKAIKRLCSDVVPGSEPTSIEADCKRAMFRLRDACVSERQLAFDSLDDGSSLNRTGPNLAEQPYSDCLLEQYSDGDHQR